MTPAYRRPLAAGWVNQHTAAPRRRSFVPAHVALARSPTLAMATAAHEVHFSSPHAQSGLVKFSPDGRLVAFTESSERTRSCRLDE